MKLDSEEEEQETTARLSRTWTSLERISCLDCSSRLVTLEISTPRELLSAENLGKTADIRKQITGSSSSEGSDRSESVLSISPPSRRW